MYSQPTERICFRYLIKHEPCIRLECQNRPPPPPPLGIIHHPFPRFPNLLASFQPNLRKIETTTPSFPNQVPPASNKSAFWHGPSLKLVQVSVQGIRLYIAHNAPPPLKKKRSRNSEPRSSCLLSPSHPLKVGLGYCRGPRSTSPNRVYPDTYINPSNTAAKQQRNANVNL